MEVVVSRSGSLAHDASVGGISLLAATASSDLGGVVDLLGDAWVQADDLGEVARNQGQVLKHFGIRNAAQVTRFGLQLHVDGSHGHRFSHRARLQGYVQYRCFRDDHAHIRCRGRFKPWFRDLERVLPWRKQGDIVQPVVVGLRGSHGTRGQIRNPDLSSYDHCTGGVRDHTVDGACSTCLCA